MFTISPYTNMTKDLQDLIRFNERYGDNQNKQKNYSMISNTNNMSNLNNISNNNLNNNNASILNNNNNNDNILNNMNNNTNNNNSSLMKSIFSVKENPNDSSMTHQVNIMEKLRQVKAAEEAKKRQIAKFMPKKGKGLNLEKFLKREQDYEQKRQYNIESLRFKIKTQERKLLKEKPTITLEEDIPLNIIKNPTTDINFYKPLYTDARQGYEDDKRNKNLNKIKEKYGYTPQEFLSDAHNQELFINNLRSFSVENTNRKYKPNNKNKINKNRNKSFDDTHSKKVCVTSTDNLRGSNKGPTSFDLDSKSQIDNNNNNNLTQEGMHKKNNSMDDFTRFYNRQEEWGKKMKQKMKKSSSVEIERKTKIYKNTKPQVSTGSIKIIKNLMNENKFTEDSIDRLHNGSFQGTYNSKENQHFKDAVNNTKNPSFIPATNKNAKYSKVMPRYYPDLASKHPEVTEVINNNRKKRKIKQSKSVDRTRKEIEQKDVMDIGQVKKNQPIHHWSTALAKLSKENNAPVEVLYKLNIMPTSSCDDGQFNVVPLQGESRNIVKSFI